MNQKIIDKYYRQTRNEREGYEKERLFFTLEEATEILNELTVELNGVKYVPLDHKIVDKAIKVAQNKQLEGEER